MEIIGKINDEVLIDDAVLRKPDTLWIDTTIEELKKENKRLNNVINELEEWLKKYKIQLKKYDCNATITVINCILNKLKELKENNKWYLRKRSIIVNFWKDVIQIGM